MAILSCAFTGHRPASFPWGYHEDDPCCLALIAVLRAEIEHLCQSSVRRFYTGMAMGVDLWAAEIVLGLRPRYDGMRLIAAVPFPGQAHR